MLAFACLVGACAAPRQAPVVVTSGVVIRDVTIVDTHSGKLAAHRTVIIEGSTIRGIAAASDVDAGRGVRIVDGKGRYLVPGYLDMHTHAMPSADSAQPVWPLLIANGITGIREMAGSPELIARTRRLNAESAAGRTVAPEVLAIAGPLIVGANTASQGVRLVDEHAAMGADFIKLIAASHDASLAVLSEAKKQGLPVAGHLSPTLSAVDSSNAGWHSIEHLGSGMGLLIDCSTDATALRADILQHAAHPAFDPLYIVSPMLFRASDQPFYQHILDTYSEDLCVEVMRTFVRNDTWQVPTLLRVKGIEESDDAALANDANLVYVDRTTRALWTLLGKRFATEVPAVARQTFRDYYARQRRLVGLMAQQHVRLMTGSDLGGIWVIPGFSLHQEFRELAAGGLTPLQVLQAATLNGAVYMGRESTMGTVEVGRNADLVLLDADPVADVAALDRIDTVVMKGQVFGHAALEAMKNDVAKAYAAQPLRDAASAIDVDHVD